MKLQTQLTKEKGYSQVMLDVDAKGQDWQARVAAALSSAGPVPTQRCSLSYSLCRP